MKFRNQVADSLRAGSNALRHARHLRYTVLVSPNKDETVVHCCYPALSVLVMLVSRNVFYAVSVLPCIGCLYIFLDSKLAAYKVFAVSGFS